MSTKETLDPKEQIPKAKQTGRTAANSQTKPGAQPATGSNQARLLQARQSAQPLMTPASATGRFVQMLEEAGGLSFDPPAPAKEAWTDPTQDEVRPANQIGPKRVFSDPAAVAERAYLAYRYRDKAGLIEALRGHSRAFSRQVEAIYRDRYTNDLSVHIKYGLDGDERVLAWALLHHPLPDAPATKMAQALLADGTRDDQVLSILDKLDLAGRRELEREYNEIFGPLGHGSLQEDLRIGFALKTSDEKLRKAQILLLRDLTEADQLYLETEAIFGRQADAALARLKAAWDRGPAAFDELVQQWQLAIVANGFAENDLPAAMRGEFRFEGAKGEAVEEILQAYESWKFHQANPAPKRSNAAPDQAQADQDAYELNAALDTMRGSRGGLFKLRRTDREQFFDATRRVRDHHVKQIRRAQSLEAGKEQQPLTAERQAFWEHQRKAVLAEAADAFGEESVHYRRVELLVLGDWTRKQVPPGMEAGNGLSLTDEVYLSHREGKRPKVGEWLTLAWARGKMNTLLEEADTPLVVEGKELRPRLNMEYVAREYYALATPGWSDAKRGSRRLRVAFHDTSADGLEASMALLTHPELNVTQRAAVIADFVAENLKEQKGDTVTHKFLNYVKGRYGEGARVADLEETLRPYKDLPEEQLREELPKRAATREVTANWYSPFAWLHKGYDNLSGDDTLKVQQEEKERLLYYANEATPQEQQWHNRKWGAKDNREGLLKTHESFKDAAAAALGARKAVVEATVLVAEVVGEMLLAFLTGGAAAGLAISHLLAVGGGMAVRKVALGDDYSAFTEANINNALSNAIPFAVAGVGHKAFKTVVNPEWWSLVVKTHKNAAAVQGAVIEGLAQASMEVALAKEWNADTLVTSGLKVLGCAGFTGMSAKTEAFLSTKGLGHGAEIIGSVVDGVGGNVHKVIVDWSMNGTGSKNGEAMVNELLMATYSGVRQAISSAARHEGQHAISDWKKHQERVRRETAEQEGRNAAYAARKQREREQKEAERKAYSDRVKAKHQADREPIRDVGAEARKLFPDAPAGDLEGQVLVARQREAYVKAEADKIRAEVAAWEAGRPERQAEAARAQAAADAARKVPPVREPEAPKPELTVARPGEAAPIRVTGGGKGGPVQVHFPTQGEQVLRTEQQRKQQADLARQFEAELKRAEAERKALEAYLRARNPGADRAANETDSQFSDLP